MFIGYSAHHQSVNHPKYHILVVTAVRLAGFISHRWLVTAWILMKPSPRSLTMYASSGAPPPTAKYTLAGNGHAVGTGKIFHSASSWWSRAYYQSHGFTMGEYLFHSHCRCLFASIKSDAVEISDVHILPHSSERQRFRWVYNNSQHGTKSSSTNETTIKLPK